MDLKELQDMEARCALKGVFTADQISNETYHSPGSPGISKSGLDLISKTPHHYRERYIDVMVENKTKAYLIGDMTHKAILEPALFNDLFATDEFAVNSLLAKYKKPRATKEYEAMMEDFARNYPNKRIVKKEEMDEVLSIVDAVRGNELASAMLSGEPGTAEQSFYWSDPETGVTCKCRVDRMRIEKGYIIEFKTSDDAGEFMRKAAVYRYDVQSAWNSWGVQMVTGEHCPMIFVVVEKTNPSPEKIRFIRYSIEAMDLANKVWRENLNTYAQCKKSGIWPGYRCENGNVGLEEISLPAWRFYKQEGLE